jgi:hypothetical protein
MAMLLGTPGSAVPGQIAAAAGSCSRAPTTAPGRLLEQGHSSVVHVHVLQEVWCTKVCSVHGRDGDTMVTMVQCGVTAAVLTCRDGIPGVPPRLVLDAFARRVGGTGRWAECARISCCRFLPGDCRWSTAHCQWRAGVARHRTTVPCSGYLPTCLTIDQAHIYRGGVHHR